MAVDTPAKIAILGAGPIGLEAALYARFLGYEVEVFRHYGDIEAIARKSPHVHITPARENTSPLGLAAISAQTVGYVSPSAEAHWSNDEWFERYLSPLSKVDLIADSLRRDTFVSAIGKVELCKTDQPHGEYNRGAWDFRLAVLKDSGDYEIVLADVVLDCQELTPCFVGHGAIPAAGSLHYQIYELGRIDPDVRRSLISDYESILIVGDDWTAAHSVVALLNSGGTRSSRTVTWATPRESEQCPHGPIPAWPEDQCAERVRLMQTANSLALEGSLRWLPGTWVESIESTDKNSATVTLSGEHSLVQTFDRIISHNGSRPDWHVMSELQLDICPITDAPRPFSEYLLKRPSPYSVEYPAPNPSALITSEPNYYVLGSKSFGRMPGFLYQHGLRQIRDVFTIIADRADLDLYAQIK